MSNHIQKILAILLVVVFVSITLFVWFPPTYETIVGSRKTGHGDLEEPIYGIKVEPKNLLLNLLPWIFFAAYLIISKER